MQTMEQKRSAFALRMIGEKFGDSTDKETANFIVGLPTMILTNGLGQTLAFLFSKAGGDHKSKHYLAGWVILKWADENNAGLGTDLKRALTKIATVTASDYLAIQRESLAMMGWLKRYARAFQQPDNKKGK